MKTLSEIYKQSDAHFDGPNTVLKVGDRHEASLEAVRAHILAKDPEVAKMREALIKAREWLQGTIGGHEARKLIDAALQNKTEGL